MSDEMFVTVFVSSEEFKNALEGKEFWGRLTPLDSMPIAMQIPVNRIKEYISGTEAICVRPRRKLAGLASAAS